MGRPVMTTALEARELNGSLLHLASTPPNSGDVEDGDIVTEQLVWVADLPTRKDAP